MKIKYYQIDAFTGELFKGNPGGVCPLDKWIDDGLMQKIAMEANLSETGFFVPRGDDFEIRWFTPAVEVEMCGHDTLACAHVIFNYLDFDRDEIIFHSMSGILKVAQKKDIYYLDFPTDNPRQVDPPRELIDGLGLKPLEVVKGRDYIALYENESDILSIKPDFKMLAELDALGIAITAQGINSDFVSRFFAPSVGIDEDPVTGSAHTQLIPYWAKKLNREKLHALQLSMRGGELFCELKGNRVIIGGRAVTYLQGEINTG